MSAILSKGIDISQWQSNINFDAVKADGIDFVIPRAGYGKNNIDPNFYNFVNGARNAGIKVPAVYWFSYALDAEMAKKEADYTIAAVEKAGLPKSTIIFFDLEYDSVTYAKKYAVNIDRNLCTRFTEAFCQRCLEKGYKTGIYANQDYCNRMYTADIIKKYPLWLAYWNGGKKPSIDCIIHQWSEKGKIAGINGNVDLNNAYIEFDTIVTEQPKEEVKPVENKQLLSTADMVVKIMAGEYGNGDERKRRLEAEGYDYNTIQSAVNEEVNKRKVAVPAKSFDKNIAGTYEVTGCDFLNCRTKAGVISAETLITSIPKGTKVQCYGYFTNVNGAWYLIQWGNTVGFVAHNYLKKI